MRKLFLVAILVAGCSLHGTARDPLCPSPSSREGHLGFWRMHAPFAEQAYAERWSLAEVCQSAGAAEAYYMDSDSPTGWCFCPVKEANP